MLTLGITIAAVCLSLLGAGTWLMGRGVILALTHRSRDALAYLVASLDLAPDGDDGAAGVVDGIPVRVTRRGGGFELAAEVGPGAHRLGIAARSSSLIGGDEALGEIAFDRRVRVWGEPPEALRARMDRETRQIVFHAVMGGASLSRGVWRIEVDLVSADRDGLLRRMWMLIDAARAVDATTGPVEQRLEAIAAEDPRPDLRYRALTARVAMSPVDVDWLRARIQANTPPSSGRWTTGVFYDWRVVVVAAQLLGEEGRPDLVRLLDARDREARRAAAIALAAIGPGEALEQVEDELIRALDQPNKAVLDAIGRVGTVRAIPALRATVGRLSDRRRTRARVLQAIAAIQARSGGPPGALSLAEVPPETGALSVAESSEVGRLGFD